MMHKSENYQVWKLEMIFKFNSKDSRYTSFLIEQFGGIPNYNLLVNRRHAHKLTAPVELFTAPKGWEPLVKTVIYLGWNSTSVIFYQIVHLKHRSVAPWENSSLQLPSCPVCCCCQSYKILCLVIYSFTNMSQYILYTHYNKTIISIAFVSGVLEQWFSTFWWPT